MAKASTYLTPEQKKRIEEEVAHAESITAAEIVPVIATASGRYDRGEDIAGLWCGVIMLIAAWILYPIPSETSGTWDSSSMFVYIVWIAALLIGFIVGAVVASRVGPLRALFTSRKEMKDEVQARARQVFFDQRIHRTGSATGLLIYISLEERMACLLADDATEMALGTDTIDELCTTLVGGLRSDPTAAIAGTIKDAGNRLAKSLPPEEGDMNEISNAVVLID